MIKSILLALLIVSIFCTTSLTTSNCPNSFDVTKYNTSLSYSNSGMANMIYGGVLSAELQAKIQSSIINGNIYTIRD